MLTLFLLSMLGMNPAKEIVSKTECFVQPSAEWQPQEVLLNSDGSLFGAVYPTGFKSKIAGVEGESFALVGPTGKVEQTALIYMSEDSDRLHKVVDRIYGRTRSYLMGHPAVLETDQVTWILSGENVMMKIANEETVSLVVECEDK